MSNFVIELHIPELAVLAEAISSKKQSQLPPTPVPATPVIPAPQPVPVAPAQFSNACPAVPTPPVAPVAPITPPAPQPMPAIPAAVPTAPAPTFAFDDLARAASAIADTGVEKRQQVCNLIAGFGIQTLQQLPKERYGEFATALRQMGARI